MGVHIRLDIWEADEVSALLGRAARELQQRRFTGAGQLAGELEAWAGELAARVRNERAGGVRGAAGPRRNTVKAR